MERERFDLVLADRIPDDNVKNMTIESGPVRQVQVHQEEVAKNA
jgi:hypothetical protein